MWEPLIRDDAELAAIARELGAAASSAARSLDELADLALLHAYADDTGSVEDALVRAVAASRDARHVALFGGLAKLGWTIAHVADTPTADALCAPIDAELLRALPREWDFASGLAGLGIYALERGDAGSALATRVLDELERLAVARGGGLAWFTPVELVPAEQRALAPRGYWNLGLAHGTPGVIAVLARYVLAERETVRAARLLDGAMAFVLGAEPADASRRYPAWHAVEGGAPARPTARLAWCYGDLGVAVALLSAAAACRRDEWRAQAIALAVACARRSFGDAAVDELGICHGAAGAAHLFHRLYDATGEPALGDAARTWLARTVAMYRTGPHAPNATLLTGATGVALVLLAAASELEPSWDRVLLADLPSR
ncbi:MAG TPA: lanthionine synthetase C family protein [Kofleriaceae bacterium]|nr:lanthionine synthetase C family protein [Kofleriaceae bacterium]